MNTPLTLSKPGTLVHARGREWVVLPGSEEDILTVRPVGGIDDEVTCILRSVEPVQSARFTHPTKNDIGDFSSGFLLREAARLSTRAASGPFRSFGRIAVEPRPYQMVPLMMALRLDPVRLLIADDIGIGKTIEACVIARELLDRGEINRLTVLCPPHLAEQWKRELYEKFHIDAELVLSSTINRLERDLPVGVSVFDQHNFTIVSTDFIKTRRRADDFVLKCPELVIVDEAHRCTLSGGNSRGKQQRYDLLKKLTEEKSRHLLLVTATPHSGNENAFRSLLGLLDQKFSDLPIDLDKEKREGIRRNLARHLIQRRRADIRHYLETDTSFPERRDKEVKYEFSKEYKRLFHDVLKFVRGYVSEEDSSRRRRRVRYWSALALLRCISSSPAAAATTLRNRAAVDEVPEDEVNEVGRRTVLDQGEDDDEVILDFSPGSDSEEDSVNVRPKLLAFARRAEQFSENSDNKIQTTVKELRHLIKDGFKTIVFCRFIDTAQYVAEKLRKAFAENIRVESVTGLLPPSEREARIDALVSEPGDYILVCTDCLSEGINLQEHFNAVYHYDLAWNPTRHEQREGRVDRFGQNKPEVRVVTCYGTDNPIDGVILDVLIRKHKKIKSDLGIAVAVPGSSEQIIETLFEGALLREMAGVSSRQLSLDFFEEIEPKKKLIHDEWENARDREKASRSRFAQKTLDPEVVYAELENVRSAIGSNKDVSHFFFTALKRAGVPVTSKSESIKVHLSKETPRSLRQSIGYDEPFTGRFDLPLGEQEVYLGRTSPVIEGLASWVLGQAFDPFANQLGTASRCGVISTSSVLSRTILLVVRFRYHIKNTAGETDKTILCEEIAPLACDGPPGNPIWVELQESEKLLSVHPEKNLTETAINQQIELTLSDIPKYESALELIALKRSEMQLEVHSRVRGKSPQAQRSLRVEPILPVDILGIYVLLPRIN